jgi:hypothetical protein
VVNIEDVKKKICFERYEKLGEKTTICFIQMDNGFEITGFSCCLEKEDYNNNIGELNAYNDALSKLCMCEAYCKLEKDFTENSSDEMLKKLNELIRKNNNLINILCTVPPNIIYKTIT